MKAVSKIAAVFAAVPVAGVIALTGAGVASAAPCPAGYHWNDMGNGAGWCAQDASGGGTGGSITYTDKPVTQPVPQAPVMPQPPAYTPPVYAPLPPPPPPVPVRPMPAPAPVNVAPAPAPAQRVPVQALAPAQVAKDRSVPVPNSVKGSDVSEIASTHGKEVSEPNKVEAEAHKDEAGVEKTEVEKVEPTVVDPAVSASLAPSFASPSPSTEAPQTAVIDSIDADRSSEVQKATALSTFIVAFSILAAFVAFLTIRNFRALKPALIESEENS